MSTNIFKKVASWGNVTYTFGILIEKKKRSELVGCMFCEVTLFHIILFTMKWLNWNFLLVKVYILSC